MTSTPTTNDAQWDILDDAGEWELFSQPYSKQTDASTLSSTWESQLVIEGMHCASCANNIERAVAAIPGIMDVKVNASSNRARIIWSSDKTKPSEWMRAIHAIGYRALPAPDAYPADLRNKEQRLMLWRWLVAGLCMMQIMMYAMPAYVAMPGEMTSDIASLLQIASWILVLPVMFFSCAPFFNNALRDLKNRQISMDLPVALGIIITFLVSSIASFNPQGIFGAEVYFDSLSMFVFFLLSGRWIEIYLRNKTAGAMDNLMRRLPESVERQNEGGTFDKVSVRKLAVGDVIRVLPGAAFAADGQIIFGNTHANEALLTGESRPIPKPLGTNVIAGSFNLTLPVHVCVEQVGKSTRYAQIVSLMERASIDKPRLALLADRFAKHFLLFVLIASAGAALLWWHVDHSKAIMAAVAVLIVTCPCALSLATPAAMLTSAGTLARRGVIVRRLQVLEALSHIDTIVFDKTGTLSKDRITVANITTRDGFIKESALQLAASLASNSLHPASRAIVQAHGENGALLPLTDVKEILGKGLSAESTRGPIRFGSASFCETTSGDTLQVHLADQDGWLASFDLEEDIRENAKQTIQRLQDLGIQVEVLSGDYLHAVKKVADAIGISHIKAQCTPQDKLNHIKELQAQGRHIAMVGDGLNDGPVLAQAHVSIAMGQAVPLAQAQSDLIVMSGQLSTIVELVLTSRRTMHIVKQNLLWALIYNITCVPLAVMGMLPAWLAGLGMALSSLLVILNAARLLKFSE